MQSPKRAILFGVYTWLIWMFLIMGIDMALPLNLFTSPLGMSLATSLLVVIALGYIVRYLYKVGPGNAGEGISIGLLWLVSFAILDLTHFMMMGGINVATYFSMYFPLYFILPILTFLTFRFMQFKKR